MGGETHENTAPQALSHTHDCPLAYGSRHACSGSFADIHCDPTTRATVPASAAPPGKATTPSATGKPGGSPRPTPVSTPSTPSTGSPAVHHPSRVQHKGEGAFVPLVLGTLSGIAAVALLVAGGRWLLRQWLLPVRKVKGPPSGAAPWQRVRTTSLPGGMNSPGDRRQPFPTPDAFLPATRTRMPSRGGGLVSHELLWAKMAGNVADAAVLETNQVGSHPDARHTSSSQEQPCHPSQAKQPANGTPA